MAAHDAASPTVASRTCMHRDVPPAAGLSYGPVAQPGGAPQPMLSPHIRPRDEARPARAGDGHPSEGIGKLRGCHARVMAGAVLAAEGSPVHLGECVIVAEHACCGRRELVIRTIRCGLAITRSSVPTRHW